MKRLALSLFLVLTTEVLSAALSAEAEQLLNSLPNRKLSLESVVSLSMKSSKLYKSLNAEARTSDASLQRAEGALNPVLSARVGWQDDKRQPQIVFSPNRLQNTQYALGLKKQFSTGTSVAAEIAHGINSIEFSTLPTSRFAESKAEFSVRQSLWKDSFGAATRAGLAAADKHSGARLAATKQAKESWFADLSSLFYESWKAQREAEAAVRNLARRERLYKIMRVRTGRGTAERPDLLQVEAARTNAEVQLTASRRALEDRWRLLIVALDLPESLFQVDPLLVPLDIGDGAVPVKDECQADPTALKASSVVRAEANRETSVLSLEAARGQKKPELDLLFAAGMNSIQPGSGATLSDFFSLKHPLLGVSLRLSVPLGFDAAAADVREAEVALLHAEAQVSSARDTLKVQKLNLCAEQERLARSVTLLKRAAENQRDRESAEEVRFQVGRASTLAVIQAGDDLMLSEQLVWAGEVELRRNAWRIREVTGRLAENLSAWEAKIQ